MSQCQATFPFETNLQNANNDMTWTKKLPNYKFMTELAKRIAAGTRDCQGEYKAFFMY